MKKVLLAAAVVSIAILSSCGKNFTCTCTSVQPDGTVVNVEKMTFHGSRNGADEDCKEYDNVNGNVTTTCNLD